MDATFSNQTTCLETLESTVPWDAPVKRAELVTLQLNIGRYCNMSCAHCHIEASPKRTEMISPETRDRLIAWIIEHQPKVVDLTGGAPELIPGFRDLVEAATSVGAQVIDRCNLSVLQEEGQEDLAEFLAKHKVHVVASLPCYLAANVDKQRGKGAYDRSIQGLKQLNAVGYGRREDLPLHLVYNPVGPSLPPDSAALEIDYKKRLAADWGISFTGLWCLTNVPIKRFRAYLKHHNQLDDYEQLLLEAYNPETLDGVMCRSTLSVDHLGRLFDCDFNLAEDLLMGGKEMYLWEMTPEALEGREVVMDRHCLACTANCGSSCTGAVK